MNERLVRQRANKFNPLRWCRLHSRSTLVVEWLGEPHFKYTAKHDTAATYHSKGEIQRGHWYHWQLYCQSQHVPVSTFTPFANKKQTSRQILELLSRLTESLV